MLILLNDAKSIRREINTTRKRDKGTNNIGLVENKATKTPFGATFTAE